MHTRIARLALRLLVASGLLAGTARAQRYAITDLGSLGGVRGSGAYATNGVGMVAGYSFVQGSTFVHAMVNDHGTVLDLGTLGGTQSLARAINASGVVVGWAYQPGVAWQRAFRWQNGVMQDLGTFGGSVSDAMDVNDAGIIVGSAWDPVPHELAFWWKDGVLHELGTLGGSQSRATAVNAWGDIVGTAQTPGDDQYHAFLGKPGSPLYDLGTLGGPASQAYDVNEQVHVCGWSMLAANQPPSRGFLWSDGLMKSLGTLGGIYSAAFGLNDLDQVVGASTRSDEVQVAFLWENGQMLDLNTLLPAGHGWLLRSAADIDENGVIVGEGVNPEGKPRAFMLTPISTTGVPPGGAAVLAFAGVSPNPVRGAGRFGFTLPAPGNATLAIYDLTGRRVRELARGAYGAGGHSVAWDGRDEQGGALPAGAYYARLATPAGVRTRRFVVLP